PKLPTGTRPGPRPIHIGMGAPDRNGLGPHAAQCRPNRRSHRGIGPDLSPLHRGAHLARSRAGSRAATKYESHRAGIEHDPEKWKPVFRKDHAQTKRLDHDAIPWKRIMI